MQVTWQLKKKKKRKKEQYRILQFFNVRKETLQTFLHPLNLEYFWTKCKGIVNYFLGYGNWKVEFSGRMSSGKTRWGGGRHPWRVSQAKNLRPRDNGRRIHDRFTTIFDDSLSLSLPPPLSRGGKYEHLSWLTRFREKPWENRQLTLRNREIDSRPRLSCSLVFRFFRSFIIEYVDPREKIDIRICLSLSFSPLRWCEFCHIEFHCFHLFLFVQFNLIGSSGRIESLKCSKRAESEKKTVYLINKIRIIHL